MSSALSDEQPPILEQRRVLVTGGTGFLGREVVRLLVERGYPVRSFSRRAAWDPDSSAVEPFAGSVLDPEAIREALAGCGLLIHLAGRVSRDRRDATSLMKLHVDGTRLLLREAVDAGIQRVVFLSTSGTIAVSSDPEEVRTEDAPYPMELVSRWPYYLSKVFAEQEALRFFRERGLPLICLNPSLILGPNDTEGSSTGDIKRFLNGMVPAVPDGGVSFVDVRDVAETVVAALHRGRPGERYLMGAANISTRDYFKRVAHMAGLPAPLVSLPAPVTRLGARLLERLTVLTDISLPITDIDLDMARHGWFVDSKKAKLELGFRPRDPDETLRDTITWLREDGASRTRDDD